MRPGGNLSLACAASMGPRLFSRGKIGHVCTWYHLVRSFNGAAAFQPRKVPILLQYRICSSASMGPRLFSRGKYILFRLFTWQWVLQWGRGFSAAESRLGAHVVCGAPLLQWGRGFSAAESATTSHWHCNMRWCFNGAAAFQPRKGWRRSPMLDDTISFNGAAAFQPRKV